jgi:hypothetical protein
MFDKRELNNTELEARAAIAFSLIDPLSVEAVVAAWQTEQASGFVFKEKTGRYAYVSRRHDNGTTFVTIKKSDSEPVYLYERAIDWKRGDELRELNHAIVSQPKVVLTEHGPGWKKIADKNIEETPEPYLYGLA